MIGQGFTSHMFRELRRERGIGYAPRATYTAMGRHAFLALGVPGLHPSNCEQAIGIMQDIVHRMKSTLAHPDFLEGKKTQMIASNHINLDEPGYRTNAFLTQEFDAPYYDFRDIAKHLSEVTPEQLRDAAERNLQGYQILIASAPGYTNRFHAQNP
ncbi:insulinase family protein [Candidatus Woesearchaeota archaeon]|nr:insulinase family protein [Candidatus Woesearchaeota archaeon]